jgi:hypothetical protein
LAKTLARHILFEAFLADNFVASISRRLVHLRPAHCWLSPPVFPLIPRRVIWKSRGSGSSGPAAKGRLRKVGPDSSRSSKETVIARTSATPRTSC